MLIDAIRKTLKYLRSRWKVKTFNLKYRMSIALAGGQMVYSMRRVHPKELSNSLHTNMVKHCKCFYSLHNGRWCTLPCIWCKKFKSVRDGNAGNNTTSGNGKSV